MDIDLLFLSRELELFLEYFKLLTLLEDESLCVFELDLCLLLLNTESSDSNDNDLSRFLY